MKTVLVLIVGLTIVPVSWGQYEIDKNLGKAKRYFWAAQFDSASKVLQEVIITPSTTQAELFEGYLYMALLSAQRKLSNPAVKLYIGKAIQADPDRNISTDFFPPDFVKSFESERNRLVGCTYIDSSPGGAEVIVLGEKIKDNLTPTTLCGLVNESHHVLFARRGYKDHFVSVRTTPGQTDTLFVTMYPSAVQKRSASKWWLWITSGGIVAATAVLTYKSLTDH